MIDKSGEIFREEAAELLAELEHCLLELEEMPEDDDLIGRVFRALHTIKGSGAMFGYDAVASFTHEIETVFDRVRNHEIPVTQKLISATLSSTDLIRNMLESPDGARGYDAAVKVSAQIDIFREILPRASEPVLPSPQSLPVSAAAGERESILYRITFRPLPHIFERGINPLLIMKELRSLGDCRVVANTDAIPPLTELEPEQCCTSWDILLITDKGIDPIRDVFIFVEGDCALDITPVCKADQLSDDEYKRLGEILIERGDVSEEKLLKVLRSKKMIGEVLVEEGLVSPSKVEAALSEQELIKSHLTFRESMSVRVASERLDKLVDLVGELVTVQARLSQRALSDTDPEILLISEEVERLTEELRASTMSIRMVPIGTTFSKFRRLVRTLSGELNKEVELRADGADTELDKTVIERLSDPIVHLIRNCIDHGIETPEERVARGKPRKGAVRLSAMHSGPHVLITIADDGRGLDRDLIAEKARSRDLIPEDANLPDRELFSLLFLPGFSTAREVTNVSGRGVGLDVVMRAIEALRGTAEIRSEKGRGTSIILKIPLTLAIIEGLLVHIGNESFVMPLSLVEECIELTREDIRKAGGRHLVPLRGDLVPYIRLREHFGFTGTPPEREQIVITRLENGRVGFVVDAVVGEHQTVIKSLGKFYRSVEGISGATILGNGTVALILDMPKLSQSAEEAEGART